MSRNNFRNNRCQSNNNGKKGGSGLKGRNSKPKETAKHKSLEDHMHCVGRSAKQATNCVTITDHLINHIRREHTKHKDITNSLESLKEIDFHAEEPQMEASTSVEKPTKECKNKDLFEKRFEIDCIACAQDASQPTQGQQGNCGCSRSAVEPVCQLNEGKASLEKRLQPTLLLSALTGESTKQLMKTTSDVMRSFINPRQKDGRLALDCLKHFEAARDAFLSQMLENDCAYPRGLKKTGLHEIRLHFHESCLK